MALPTPPPIHPNPQPGGPPAQPAWNQAAAAEAAEAAIRSGARVDGDTRAQGQSEVDNSAGVSKRSTGTDVHMVT